MNETAVGELSVNLAETLLSSEYGVDEAGWDALISLLLETVDEETLHSITERADYTDGYYYFPVGNELEPEVELYDDLAD